MIESTGITPNHKVIIDHMVHIVHTVQYVQYVQYVRSVILYILFILYILYKVYMQYISHILYIVYILCILYRTYCSYCTFVTYCTYRTIDIVHVVNFVHAAHSVPYRTAYQLTSKHIKTQNHTKHEFQLFFLWVWVRFAMRGWIRIYSLLQNTITVCAFNTFRLLSRMCQILRADAWRRHNQLYGCIGMRGGWHGCRRMLEWRVGNTASKPAS